MRALFYTSKILIKERNRLAKIRRAVKFPTTQLNHYRPSYLSRFFDLVTAVEVVSWLEQVVIPTLKNNEVKRESAIEIQALLIGLIETIEEVWKKNPFFMKWEYRTERCKKRLTKLSKLKI